MRRLKLKKRLSKEGHITSGNGSRNNFSYQVIFLIGQFLYSVDTLYLRNPGQLWGQPNCTRNSAEGIKLKGRGGKKKPGHKVNQAGHGGICL